MIEIQIKGIAAELTLGNYMPTDSSIFNNWEDFYHYNDLIHQSQLMMEHVAEIQIKQDGEVVFTGKIPAVYIHAQKSFSPVMENRALYLRTECVEEAIFHCQFEIENFDKKKLRFETQDYDALFKVGQSFLSKMKYDDNVLNLEWKSAKPIGNICVLCRFENGYFVPVYDAVNKKSSI